MLEEFVPLPITGLLDRILREEKALGTVLGLHRELFRLDLRGAPFATTRRGHRLDAPIGVAAGPHSQLAGNILAAWLCGARYIELKTVQVLDEIDIPRPCIDMADEGYNVEWSQELSIEESAREYETGWALVRLMQHRAGLVDGPEAGFVMDLSAGYDLEGIRSAKVQRFLDRMTRSNDGLKARLHEASSLYPAATDIPLPESLSDSITLSTMHGCPPEEIERIGRFLLEERGLHTVVKLNPTLLGARELRELLCDELGYDVEVPDEAFGHDLKWDVALDILESLQATAKRAGLAFGVKLTNTLECVNKRGVLPASSAMSYMSGRALHPLSVRVAARIQEAFEGEMDISFAGGADAWNVSSLLASGLSPVTVCSDLLRPGGYLRLRQYLDEIESAMSAAGASDLHSFILETADREGVTIERAALANLRTYAEAVSSNPTYKKDTYVDRTVKTDRPLEALDCIFAPCVYTCPANQDVAAYMAGAAEGRFEEALQAIHCDNPFPNVTGMACDESCRTRCMRLNYDEPLRIRDVKRALARCARATALPRVAPPTGRKVAIIGAGPAGLSCAWYLTLAGVEAAVLEAKPFAGGMVTDAIPVFRLEGSDFARDMARLEEAGVEVRTSERVDRAKLLELREEHDFVFLGIGAQLDRSLSIPGESNSGVVPALEFLSKVRRGEAPSIGKDVVVIGGGNTAMDAARTAARLLEPGGSVRIVYRRTKLEMPAAREELHGVEQEGIFVHELLAPSRIESSYGRLSLTCQCMTLGAPDSSGRPRPVPVAGETRDFLCDTIIPAVGQRLEGGLLEDGDLPGDRYHRDSLLQTKLDKVLVGGDAIRGPATLIRAIADGRRAADLILSSLGLPASPRTPSREGHLSRAFQQNRAARLRPAHRPHERVARGHGDFGLLLGQLSLDEAKSEAERCLDCAVRCDVCVSVCPNRANISYEATPRELLVFTVVPSSRHERGFELKVEESLRVTQKPQTANIVDLCNACGNCATFCPTAGAPFRDKPRIALSSSAFDSCDGVYRISNEGDTASICWRAEGKEEKLTMTKDGISYETEDVNVLLDATSLEVMKASFSSPHSPAVSTRRAAVMAVLLEGLRDHPLAQGS